MDRRFRALAVSVLALALALALAPARGEEEAGFPPDDTAVVRVVGPDGDPVAGATVELLAEPAVVSAEKPPAVAATGVTGEGGRVRLDVTPFARYLLRVSAPGFATASDAECFGGNETTFALSRPGAIRGTVTDRETGHPVAGAMVHAFDYTFYGVARSWAVRTSANGSFAIEDAAPGYLNVEVRAPGHGPVVAPPPMVAPGESVRCDVALSPAVTVKVTALDDVTGEPLPEVTIASRRWTVTGSGSGLESPALLFSGEDDVRAWALTVTAPGHVPGFLPVDGPAARLSPPPAASTIRLARAVVVTGKMLGEDGSPAAGVAVSLLSLKVRDPGNDWTPTLDRLVETGPDGTFSAPVGVPGGEVVLQIFRAGTWCRGRPAEVPADADTLALSPIRLADGASVRGLVRAADGTPRERATVTAFPANVPSRWYLAAGWTDPRGRYLLPWVPKGPIRVAADAGEERSRSVDEDLQADLTIDLELPAR